MPDHHTCPYPNCDFPVDDARLCCPAHWKVLPADLRRRIGQARHNRHWDKLHAATTEAFACFRAAASIKESVDA